VKFGGKITRQTKDRFEILPDVQLKLWNKPRITQYECMTGLLEDFAPKIDTQAVAFRQRIFAE